MDMKKMIQRMTDLENAGKKNLNESTLINECPPMDAPMAAQNPGSPVTMSISLNASGKDHVADLINMMKNAGLEDAKPAADAIMPMRTDMERLRGIVDGPAGGLGDRKMDLPGPDDIEGSEDEAYAEVINDDDLEEYDNEPNPEYQDHKYMTKDLSGGLNREKNSYAAAQPGDNAMAVEDDDDTSYSIKGKTPDAKRELAKRANSSSLETSMEETIKAQLYKALTEKKAKPDFLDLDKDGDKKEPMKKAAQDAKKGSTKDTDSKTKGLSDKQKKLPAGLQKAIAKKKTNEAEIDEISSDLAKRYTKNAKVDRDNTDHILKRDGSTNDQKANQELQRRNSKRTKGINRAAKRIEK